MEIFILLIILILKELFKTPDNPIFELFYINVEEIRTFDLKTYTNENFKIEKHN